MQAAVSLYSHKLQELLAVAIAVKPSLEEPGKQNCSAADKQSARCSMYKQHGCTISVQAMILARAYGCETYREKFNPPGISQGWRT